MRFNRYAMKRALLRLHKLGIKFGVFILPVHYYSPVPNIVELEKTRHLWAKRSELPGLDVDLDEQVAVLQRVCEGYKSEYAGNSAFKEGVANHFGPGYGYIEAQALHAVIRYYKPARIVEVGSGVSTYCMLKATELNESETGEPTSIVSIEPYPSQKLRSLSGVELIAKPVQTVPLEVFAELGAGDLLFIDSSHTVKPGGDVNYLILEVLPRLRPGVIVHFHDIYLPYDYRRAVLRTFLHWTETSLLRAYLISNHRAKILFCLSHLHYERKDALKSIFPEYTPQEDNDGLQPEKYKPFEPVPEHFPSSIYIEVQ